MRTRWKTLRLLAMGILATASLIGAMLWSAHQNDGRNAVPTTITPAIPSVSEPGFIPPNSYSSPTAPRTTPAWHPPQTTSRSPEPEVENCDAVADQEPQVRRACQWFLLNSGAEVNKRVTGGYLAGEFMIVLAYEMPPGGAQHYVYIAESGKDGSFSIVSPEVSPS